MNKRVFSLIPIVLILSFLFASSLLAEKKPAPINLKSFDRFVEKAMQDWKVPGLALAIVKDNQVVYAKGYGYRDVKNSLKVTPQTIFAIGSCTKAFTTTAMGILVDEGKLDWNKPVREYLPTFKLYDDYSTEHITPKDLVIHRSGLPRHDILWYGAIFNREELYNRLRYLEPSKELRELYQYNNLMFMTAGYMVGEIAGKTWEEFVKERILDSLEMKNTNFSVTVSQKSTDFARPYRLANDTVKEIPFKNIDATGPAGSINSNVLDMGNWILLHLNKGKFKDKQIISERSLEETHTPQMAEPSSMKYDEIFYSSYGMGWRVTSYRGHLLVYHMGAINGFMALVALLPKDKAGVVVLTNLNGNNVLSTVAYNIYDRALGLNQVPWNERKKVEFAKEKEAEAKSKTEKDPNQKEGTKPSHPLSDYCGKFENLGYGVVSIELAGEELKLTYYSFSTPLKHYHYDVFQTTDEETFEKAKVKIFTSEQGNIDKIAIPFEPTVSDIVFTRIPEEKLKEKSFLEKFVGEYELVGTILKVSLRGENTLIFSVPGQPDYECVPSSGTTFNFKNLSGFSIEFKMDESGNVKEAVLTQPNGVFTLKRK